MSPLLRISCLTVSAVAVLTAGPAFATFASGPSDYYQSGAAYDYVNIDAVGTTVITTNDAEIDVTLPWAFPFFGNSYTEVQVGGTGGVGFGGTTQLYNGNDDLPDLGFGSHDIAAFWDGLNASLGNGVATHHDTVADRFIIDWDVSTDTGGTDRTLSFQMHLYANGDIQFHYEDVVTSNVASLGGSATVGIQDYTGGTAINGGNWMEFSYNTPSLSNGFALHYGIDAAAVDGDGDGFASSLDCDDTTGAVSPGSAEFCADGLDQDCDGVDELSDVDGDGSINAACGGDDCNDNDATVDGLDADGDGFSICDGDCDDAAADAYPGAPEICDSIDQNCDGITDDEQDLDGDGFTSCNAATGQAPGGDCDDTNANVSPALAEVCGDGLDNDCDGLIENVDADNDGQAPTACGGGDCDDADPLVYTGAPETCDGADVDENCNGVSDSFDLSLGLVTSVPGPAVGLPSAITGASNGVATVEFAAGSGLVGDLTVTIDVTHVWDGDLAITLTSPAGTNVNLSDFNGGSLDNYSNTTFNDAAATPISSGSPPFAGTFQPEQPLSTFNGETLDGVWTLTVDDLYCCNPPGSLNAFSMVSLFGTVDDADTDGNVDSCGDCDATDPAIYEGAVEVCGDGIDQDCSGADDLLDQDGDGEDAIVCGGADCDDNDSAVFSTADADSDSVTACDGDCDDNDPLVYTGATETECDTVDSDCDGFDGIGIDGTEDTDGDGETVCAGDCDDALDTVNTTAAEACNGLDNDCDGTVGIDDDLDGITSCGDEDCDDTDPLIYPGAPETCDGADVDSNCDGNLDGFDLLTDASTQTDVFTGSLTDVASGVANLVPPSGTSGTGTYEAVATGTAGPVADINVSLDITHTWDSDLDVTLTSPDGTVVELFTDVGGSGDDFTNTVLDDEASTPITAGTAPFTGTFSPEGNLGDFDGETADGTWTLTITDDAGGDSGTLNSWAIELESASVTDSDGDGNVDLCGDCDDTDPAIYEGAPEDCGVTDNNCDGVITALDVDADGENDTLCIGGTDCDDADPAINAAAVEVCDDGVDNDCSDATADLFDGDNDGETCDTDCDDSDAAVFTGAFEVCNDGIDNDCDVTTLDLGDADGDGITCDLDCDDTNASVLPGGTEAFCDNTDNDCDPATPDIGDGDGDTFTCDLDCDDTDAAVNPAATEVLCDGVDNDCDPSTDGEADGDGDGFTCFDDCDDGDASVNPGAAEVCGDTIDNDCDAATPDILDADGDGELCDTDCDDGDPLVFTGAPEWCFDALDQDCDGSFDETVDDSYAMDNDGDLRIGLCGGTTFDFCGTTWDTLYVQSNGRVTFGFSDTDHTESVGEFTLPQIAPMWTDLDPSLNEGTDIHVTEDDLTGDVIVTFTDVAEVAAAGTSNTWTLTLYADGTANITYGTNTVMDGLVGYACGDGTNGAIVPVDYSDDVLEPNQWAFGSGTDDAVFEVFTEATNPNDTSDTSIDLCLTAGTDGDADGWTDTCGDCDDEDPTSYPGAEELCDTIDNDCDGVEDNVDADDDTFIDADCGGDDCDDTSDITYPGAPEQCDGLDNDCDDAPEEGSEDDDADGVSICAGDCDDSNDTVYGGDSPAEEICDLLDNDCNEVVDDGFNTDVDDDGYDTVDCGGDDCDDREAAVFPGGDEVCDQLDNDCDGTADNVDQDEDGFFSAACGGEDCDDESADVNPDAEEVPYDGIDNDCSEGDLLDADGDGYQSEAVEGGTDCDDNNAAVNPGAAEDGDVEGTCSDGMDNNCDGVSDVEDELCSSCENCNASYTGEGPMGTAQLAFALLMTLGLGLRRRRE